MGPAAVNLRKEIALKSGTVATVHFAEKVDILPGFPERVKGRLVFMPQDNVNTDAIYGKDYTYRDDMTKEMMAKVVMENCDPQFASRTHAGDVIVSGDAVMGEIGVAVVVPRDPDRPPDLATMRAYAKDSVAAYKLPEALHVVDALPLTAGDKVDRRALVDEIAKLD